MSLASQPLVGVVPPSLNGAEQQEVTGSRPTGWFSNSRTLRAVCEGMAGVRDQYNRYGSSREDVSEEISAIRNYTLGKKAHL